MLLRTNCAKSRFRCVWLVPAALVLGSLALTSVAVAEAAQRTGAERARHHLVYGPPPLVRPGHRVNRLPNGYHRLRLDRHRYFYHHGVFYRPHRSRGYIVVTAPFGARVRHLPPGHVSFWWRDGHYSYINMTYFLWDVDDREYVVVKAPEGAVDAMVSASGGGASELFVYPTQGQSEGQRDRDRYECYLWAVEETGYDPAGDNQAFARAADYRRALTACLEGRGYTVG